MPWPLSTLTAAQQFVSNGGQSGLVSDSIREDGPPVQKFAVSVVEPVLGNRGWEFGAGPGATLDTVNGKSTLAEIYILTNPHYTGRVTVPVLWDRSRPRRYGPLQSFMTEVHIHRKLAAILVADVVGYSRLMGADEAGTLAALKRYREAVFDPAVAAHNGRIVKLIGDGTIVEFGSVVDAVNCALSIQRVGASPPDHSPSQPAIVLRIGINLGDVIMEGDDIYGDGVNIAARLEPLAKRSP